jgi:hypothetical protein
MDEKLAVIIAAAIGALAGFGGALLNAWCQSRLEQAKWRRTRDDEHTKELRDSLQNFATKLASGVHAMSWLTWLAKEKPSRLNEERINQYNNDIHGLLADITGLKAKIISLDKTANEQVAQLAKEVYALDAKVAKAGLQFDVDRETCISELAALYDKVSNMEDKIPIASARIVETYVENKNTE